MRKNMTFFLTILLITLNINIFATAIELTQDNFMAKIQSAKKGDQFVLTQDITFTTGYQTGDTNTKNGYTSISFNGITIDGNNHRLKLVGRNIELNEDSTLKNIKVTLAMPDATSSNNSGLDDYKKSAIIYANGNSLTLDNVSFTPETSDALPVRPTIIMGTKKGTAQPNKENKLEIVNSKEAVELKTIIAGSDGQNKTTKTTINLDENVKLVGTTENTIILKNIDNNMAPNVEVNNKSKEVRTFDMPSDSSNIKITLDGVKYTENKRPEFKGKVNELNIKNGTNLTLYTTLNVDTLNLVKENGKEAPKLKVSKQDNDYDDDMVVSTANGSITANTITSNSDENKVILDQKATITATTVNGKMDLETTGDGSNKSNFTGYNEKTNGKEENPNEENDNGLPVSDNSGKEIETLKEKLRIAKQELKAKKENASYNEINEAIKKEVEQLEQENTDDTLTKEQLEEKINKVEELTKKVQEKINEVGLFKATKSDLLSLIDNSAFLGDEKEEFKKKVQDAKDLNVLNTLKQEIEQKNKEKVNAFDRAKAEAKQYIEELTLTEKQKEEAKKEIDGVSEINQIEPVKDKAKVLNLKMIELYNKKSELLTLKNNSEKILTDEVKESIKEALEKDADYENIKDVNKVGEVIEKVKEEIIKVKALIEKLDAKKAKEIATLESTLTNLTLDEITDFKNKITQAATEQEVGEVLEQAKQKNEENKRYKQELGDLKVSVKETIENLNQLTEKHKNKYNQQVEEAKTKEAVKEVETIANKVNEAMKQLRDLQIEIETLVQFDKENYDKLVATDKAKIDTLLVKLYDEKNYETEESIKALINEARKEFENIKAIIEIIKEKGVVDLEQYKKYIGVFDYTNTEITNLFDKPTYFNISLGKNIKDFKDVIAGINVGINYNINDKLRVGAFASYQKDKSTHYIIGTNAIYDDLLGFVRYRMSNYEKLSNHNIDVFVKYNKKININENFSITPALGTYISYSTSVNIDENVKLNSKYIALADIETKLNYNTNGYNIYIIPNIKVGYNTTILQDINYENNKLIDNSNYLNYTLIGGLSKKFEKILLDINLGISGNKKGIQKVKTNIGLGYYY